jgi:hypothetical protein
MKRTLLALGMALALIGCGHRDDPVPAPVVNPPPATQPVTPPNPPDTTSDYLAKIKDAEARQAAAKKASDRLAQLQAEKDEAVARAALAREEARIKTAEAAQWKGVAGDKDKEIRIERENMMATKLYWLVGILGLLALAATVVAIWQPLVRRFAGGFALACASVATIAFFAAVYIHYIIWAGGGLVVIGVIAALIYMRRSDKAVLQVASAVESVKDQIPDFKKTFASFIDTDAEAHIDGARSWLKKQQAKVAGSKLMAKLKGD